MVGVVLRRLALLLAPIAVALCGSAGAAPTRLAEATARTTAAGTASFTLAISGSLGGATLTTHERGAVSFTRRAEHIYKLVPNNPIPEEEIVIGPLTYTNAGVAIALSNPKAKPWTKLDTRKLPASRRLAEIDHVRALAYLAGGVTRTKQIGPAGTLTRFSARVEPKQVLVGVPGSQRKQIASVLATDFTPSAFNADFWLDTKSRVRRVRVAYKTKGGTTITILAGFSNFGSPVNLKLPPAREIADITPR